ncbi:MAG: LPS export ABC transporter ATP-binding protein [Candidatus Sumerlaeia bacterium]|nr:LPS export ABC transporter ATP-binding protein [Candidatus Sumerlaeia bacterium]
MQPIRVHTQNLVKTYGTKTVVDRVSLEVKQGEIVGLLGANGAGKTTTFKMMVGFTRPTKGSVHIGDRDITRLAIQERARLGISYLCQETSVFRKMTVRENLRAILEPHGLKRAQIRERTDELIEDLGLGGVARQLAGTLSGGEKRRVEIARALALEPKIIFLDEPFAAIDPKTVEDLQAIVKKLKERGLGILITDHNVRETLYVTDRSYLMHEGQVLVSGTVSDIAQNEEIRRAYITDRIVRDLLADQQPSETPAPTAP